MYASSAPSKPVNTNRQIQLWPPNNQLASNHSSNNNSHYYYIECPGLCKGSIAFAGEGTLRITTHASHIASFCFPATHHTVIAPTIIVRIVYDSVGVVNNQCERTFIWSILRFMLGFFFGAYYTGLLTGPPPKRNCRWKHRETHVIKLWITAGWLIVVHLR